MWNVGTEAQTCCMKNTRGTHQTCVKQNNAASSKPPITHSFETVQPTNHPPTHPANHSHSHQYPRTHLSTHLSTHPTPTHCHPSSTHPNPPIATLHPHAPSYPLTHPPPTHPPTPPARQSFVFPADFFSCSRVPRFLIPPICLPSRKLHLPSPSQSGGNLNEPPSLLLFNHAPFKTPGTSNCPPRFWKRFFARCAEFDPSAPASHVTTPRDAETRLLSRDSQFSRKKFGEKMRQTECCFHDRERFLDRENLAFLRQEGEAQPKSHVSFWAVISVNLSFTCQPLRSAVTRNCHMKRKLQLLPKKA